MFLSSFFFFFKPKTAYEMRISDWSSDVCSSDLHAAHGWARTQAGRRASAHANDSRISQPQPARDPRRVQPSGFRLPLGHALHRTRQDRRGQGAHQAAAPRSEEHTSELQSLMRTSYADFRLQKKNNKNT